MIEPVSHAPGSAAPTVSVLVVAFNSRALIGRCLKHIFDAAPGTAIEVLFVDNGTDGTQELVAEEFPDVRIVQSSGNVGFAAANNALAQHAQGEFLLLVNPDLFLRPRAIDILVAGARRHPDAVAWGGITIFADGNPDTGNAIAIPSLKEFASMALGRSLAGQVNAADFQRDAPVNVLCGGLVMVSREAWNRIGGMDETFFLYCEEVDFFVRLREQGYSLYRIAEARGEHLIAHGGNLSPRRLMFKTAGTMQFLQKHWPAPKRTLGGVLLWLAAFERFLAGKMVGRWKPRFAQIGEAYSDVALKPHLWWHGYDRDKGYKAWLDRKT